MTGSTARRTVSALTAVGLLVAAGGGVTQVRHEQRVARNVIYVQGDGMGRAQRDLIRLATVGRHGQLAMDRLPVAGSVHTDPADPEEAVTDSAAAATAMATGHKTYNGAVGVDAHGRRLTTVLELAKRAGKATGLVTTAQATGASPAAFAAHVPDRDDQSEIARQYVTASRPDVIMGGGEDWWYPKGDPGAWPDHPPENPDEASQGTKGDLVRLAERHGYDHVTNRRELRATHAARILGLFANEEMFQARAEGEGDEYRPHVSLPEMTGKALDTLSRNRRGFFLMVEEEGIDSMAHANNARRVIQAGRALERTVELVLRFAAHHPDTLVIIGGDHETGGLAIESVDGTDAGEDGPFRVAGGDVRFTVDWTTDDHTGVDIPVTATGPGAYRLDGSVDNTDMYDAMVVAMRLPRTPTGGGS